MWKCTAGVSVSQTETVWHDEDVVDLIEEIGDTVALIFLSGV